MRAMSFRLCRRISIGTMESYNVLVLWIPVLLLTVSCWHCQARFPHDSRSHSRRNQNSNNPLWREEFLYTGERRGPNFSSNAGKLPRYYPRKMQSEERNLVLYERLLKGGSSTTTATAPLHQMDDRELEQDPILKLFQWKRKKGKIIIDLGSARTVEQYPQPQGQALLQSTATNNSTMVTGTSTNNNNQYARRQQEQRQMSLHRQQSALEQSASSPISTIPDFQTQPRHSKDNWEISLLIDPSSCIRMLQTFFKGSAGCLGAALACLRLLAPMIVARRVLLFFGYIGLDYYNGRYLRTTYNKRLANLEQYEIPSYFRAGSRILGQWLGMHVVGSYILEPILQWAPCWFTWKPLCGFWHGSVWILGILATARIAEVTMITYIPALQIHPVETTRRYSRRHVFTRPWHLLQWMKDPEGWLTSIATASTTSKTYQLQEIQHPDALLFPSTWPPLHILTMIGIVQAIRIGLSTTPSSSGGSSSSLSSMREAVYISLALYEEWHRMFLQEKRLACGTILQGCLVLALGKLVLLLENGLAVAVLVPAVMASVVSTWMSVVLYNERWVNTRTASSPSSRRKQRR